MARASLVLRRGHGSESGCGDARAERRRTGEGAVGTRAYMHVVFKSSSIQRMGRGPGPRGRPCHMPPFNKKAAAQGPTPIIPPIRAPAAAALHAAPWARIRTPAQP